MPLRSAEELAGFAMFGSSDQMVLGERLYSPAAGGNAVRSIMRMGAVQAQTRAAQILAGMGISSETARLFLSRRELVRRPNDAGGALEARPVVPGLDLDDLSNYSASDAGYDVGDAGVLHPVIDSGRKTYKLNSLFRDSTLTDKLNISARRMQAARRLALSNPAGAAATLTEYVQEHGFPNARVLAGDYARTVGNAVDFIRTMGRSVVYSDAAAPAIVTRDQVHIAFDQFHLRDIIWTVKGPLKYATEVNVVYQLAIHYGPEHVLLMLGSETLRLGIEIQNEKTGDYYSGAVNGYSSLSGIQPGVPGFPSELTAEQQAQLLAAGKKVSPVCVGSAVVGTAVHVSDKHAILNEHTLAAAGAGGVTPELRGKVINQSTSVSGDICMVRSDGVHAQWLLREPELGERVVLCFSVGGSVEYSEVLQVVGCAEELVLSGSNVLRKGASGAAVVSLRDFALLGIFSTVRASRVVCAIFSSSTFTIVSDCQSIASASQHATTPGVEAGDQTYARMVRRGLLGFLEHIDKSVAPVYVVEQGRRKPVGLVANVAGEWYTTVDPDESQLVMSDLRPLTFRTSVTDVFVAEHPPPVLQAVPNVRAAEPGERVFVFTKVDDDVVMSSVKMVNHCLVDNKAFVVEDFGESIEEMVGGLIVAERDAAVLGMYVRRVCDSFGKLTVYCVAMSRGGGASVSGLSVADMQDVRAELTSWVAPVAEVFFEYVEYGKRVWYLAVGRKVHGGGGSLSRVVASADLWRDRHRGVLDGFLWIQIGGSVLDRYDSEDVAYAVLAMMYLRNMHSVVSVLDSVLDGLAVGATPVTGSFPFPRPLSSTGSVVSVSASTVVEPLRDVIVGQGVGGMNRIGGVLPRGGASGG